jgi:hypothetical protein
MEHLLVVEESSGISPTTLSHPHEARGNRYAAVSLDATGEAFVYSL